MSEDTEKETDDVRARKTLIGIAYNLANDMNKALLELREATHSSSYNFAMGEQIKIFRPCTTAGGVQITVPDPELCLEKIEKALNDYKSYYEALRELDEHVRREGLDKYLFMQRTHSGIDYWIWPVSLPIVSKKK